MVPATTDVHHRPITQIVTPPDESEAQLELTHLRHEVNILRKREEWIQQYVAALDDELRLARRLQQDFLPKTLPAIGPVRFSALYRPAGYVSGDLYHVTRLDERHVGFYVADAVGHGMPAALLTMFIKNALVTKDVSSTGYRLLTPGEALARLNTALHSQDLSHATFATALYGYIDVQSLKMTFSRAGHPHPILLPNPANSAGATELANEGGPLLGIFENETFADSTVQLHPGDRVFVFTDGVEVMRGGDSPLDSAAWLAELSRHRSLPTQAILNELASLADTSAGSLTPKDDLTIIAIEVV